MFETVTNNIYLNEDLISRDGIHGGGSRHKKTLSNINGYMNKNITLKKSFIEESTTNGNNVNNY